MISDADDEQTNKLDLSWASAYAICNTALKTMVHVGQIWECVTQTTSLFYEIAGFDNARIFYYPWLNKDPTTVNSKLHLTQGTSVMMVAGSQHHDTMANIFPPNARERKVCRRRH